VSDLGDLLELLYGAGDRWTTFRGTIRSWHDGELMERAFEADRSRGTGITRQYAIAGDEPEERTYENLERLWIAKPDRLRLETEGSTVVTRDGIWWSYSELGGLMTNEHDPDAHHGSTPESVHPELLAPGSLLSGLRFGEIARSDGYLLVEASPSADQRGFPPVHGADRYRLRVDAERGVVRRFESFFEDEPLTWVALAEAVFDEPIDDELFVLVVPDGTEPHSPFNRDRSVTLEEAAELASFPVFAISELPEGMWRLNATFFSFRDTEMVTLIYHRADARGSIHVSQQGGDVTTWLRMGDAAYVHVVRDETKIDLSSQDYDEAALQDLAGKLERV
jgi:outer membrane lipoprotein-sorting protein